MSRVDIVIVNWNAGVQLRDCVRSVFAHEDEALGAVIVVDNASVDGSADFCRTDGRIILIEPGRNLGFGSACNRGAAAGTGEFILFLNPDTRLLRPTLRAVASFMEQEGDAAGVCGVTLLGEDGTVAKHCARLPSATTFFHVSAGTSKLLPRLFPPVELVEFDHAHTAQVPHVMGAFYLMPRRVFERMGGFDEAFFVFYEDLDLSLRVKQAGYDIHYLSSESIMHRTGGTSRSAKAKALSYLLDSRMTYARKHYSTAGRWLVAAGVVVVEPARRLLQALARGTRGEVGEVVGAYKRLWAMRTGRAVDRR